MASPLTVAARHILASKRCVVFTGAGMSADSGVDTFRSAGGTGFWGGVAGKAALAYGGTPLGWNCTPGLVWSYFISSFLEPIYNATPHDGYYALVELEKECYPEQGSFHVVTMNVDGFHQASGTSPAQVSEVHGTIRLFECIQCKQRIDIADPLPTRSSPPRCTACGGYPRPSVTLFTEALPQNEWRTASCAMNRLRSGNVLLVIGTSSVVYPAASLPEIAKSNGAVVIEVNPDENTPLSGIVDVKLNGGAKDMLTALVAAIKEEKNKPSTTDMTDSST